MPKVTEAYLEARRREILDAAIACFTRKGFHQTTMDDICHQAELSPGAIYRYFASKEEIINAAVRENRSSDVESWPDFTHWIEEEITRTEDFAALINMFNKMGMQRYEKDSEIVEVELNLYIRSWAEALRNQGVREEILERWKHRLGLFEKIISQAQKLGQINSEIDPGAAARVILATSEGTKLLWMVDPDFDDWKWKFNDAETALYTGNFWRRDD